VLIRIFKAKTKHLNKRGQLFAEAGQLCAETGQMFADTGQLFDGN